MIFSRSLPHPGASSSGCVSKRRQEATRSSRRSERTRSVDGLQTPGLKVRGVFQRPKQKTIGPCRTVPQGPMMYVRCRSSRFDAPTRAVPGANQASGRPFLRLRPPRRWGLAASVEAVTLLIMNTLLAREGRFRSYVPAARSQGPSVAY
jgi:hypothetical protein